MSKEQEYECTNPEVKSIKDCWRGVRGTCNTCPDWHFKKFTEPTCPECGHEAHGDMCIEPVLINGTEYTCACGHNRVTPADLQPEPKLYVKRLDNPEDVVIQARGYEPERQDSRWDAEGKM